MPPASTDLSAKGRQTRLAIEQAARKLFAERGFHGTTLGDITSAAGRSTAAVSALAIIAWMAGMLYLPRLFVYHADTQKGSEQSETFKIMERRLYRLIINPAMVATWVFGLWLAWKGFAFSGGWLHAKIALVLVLPALTGTVVA